MNKKRRNYLIITVIAVVVPLFALLVGLALLPTPGHYPVPVLSVEDAMAQTSAALRLYRMVKKSKPGEVREITFTPREADAMLHTAQFAAAVRQKNLTSPAFRLGYDGTFHGAVLLPRSGRKWVEISGSAQIEADETTEKVTVLALRVGWLPLPPALGRMAADAALLRLRNNKYYRELRPGLKAVEALTDGSLKIRFEPYFYRKFERELKALIFGK